MKIILGTPLNAIPKPWLYFKVNAIMVNAFELSRKTNHKINDAPIQTLLNYSGEVWVDSGGYQFLRHGKSPSIEDIAKTYLTYWDGTYYLNLDYPPLPTDDEYVAKCKFEKSFQNYVQLSKYVEREGLTIIPVVHFYYKTKLTWFYLKKYLDFNPEVIAVGAIVPYVLFLRGVPKGSRKNAINFLKELREFCKCKIHVLGLGSPIVTAILKLLGIDSTDSSTWRIKAAYGKILLPGGGEIHVTSRSIKFGRRKATKQDIQYIYEFLKKHNFPLIDRFDEIYTSFEYRALVNAYIVQICDIPPKAKQFEKIYKEILQEKVIKHVNTFNVR